MSAFFTAIFEKVTAVLQWCVDLVLAVFLAFYLLVKDGFSWLFDQVLSVAVSAVGAINVSALTGISGWSAVPGEILNVLSLLGVGTAVSIITAAIGIRIVLQLIPFVRLGS